MYDDTRLVYTTAMQKDFEGNLSGFVILSFSYGLFVAHLSERGNRYYSMRGKVLWLNYLRHVIYYHRLLDFFSNI